MYEVVDKDRLDVYLDGVRELDKLLRKKELIIEKCGQLKGVDYSRCKVTNGTNQAHSQEEFYAAALFEVNKTIDALRAWIIPEHKALVNQIARLKKYQYRKIVTLRYLEKWKWSEIIQDFFGLEADYEEQKELRYKDTIMYWHRQAIKELEKVSKAPFISYQQLVLISGEN